MEEDETEAAIPDDESAPDSEEKSDDEVRDEINGPAAHILTMKSL